MLGYWPVFLILALMAAVSVVVASLPLRSTRLRLGILTGHVVVSMMLILLPDDTRPLWVMVFGPGLLVAVIRLVMMPFRRPQTPPPATVDEERQESR